MECHWLFLWLNWFPTLLPIKLPIWGMIKQCKCMVILMEFSYRCMKFRLVIHHDRQVDGSPLGLIIAQHPRVDGLVISAVRESEAIQQKLGSKKMP